MKKFLIAGNGKMNKTASEALDFCKELVVVFFAFRTTNQFTNSRNKNVYCFYSFSVLILFHIE